MNLNITLVPFGSVARLIPALMPYLQESANWTRGRATVDDILRFVLSGQMMLWCVYDVDTEQVHGQFITEFKQYPQTKMLVIQYCSMTPNVMEQVEDKMQEIAIKFARDAECAGIEFIGRPGWKRHAEKYGYTTQSVSYQKFFK